MPRQRLRTECVVRNRLKPRPATKFSFSILEGPGLDRAVCSLEDSPMTPSVVHSEQTSQALLARQAERLHKNCMRLRILHVIPQFMPGGTEYTLLRVIRGLGEEEFEHRIGQELHDGIGQELTCLTLLADALHNQLQAAGTPNVAAALRTLRLSRAGSIVTTSWPRMLAAA